MKAHLTRRYIFSASHRLHSDQLSEAENRAIYGKCNNPHGHGHNYALEVTVSGQVSPRPEWSAIWSIWTSASGARCWSASIIENLNTRPEFADQRADNRKPGEVIFDILKRKFHAAHLEKVRIEETQKNSFEYYGREPTILNTAFPPTRLGES